MEEFLKRLKEMLDHYENTENIDEFEEDFNNLVHEYKHYDEIQEIAKIVAHNYNCHYFNRKNAIINTIEEWEKYNED